MILQNPHAAEPRFVSVGRRKILMAVKEEALRSFNIAKLDKVLSEFKNAIPQVHMVRFVCLSQNVSLRFCCSVVCGLGSK